MKEEIKVYVCWEWGSPGARKTDPALMHAFFEKELLNFANHPKREEILAIADLIGRSDDPHLGKGDDGRCRFSEDFSLPLEWFEGWEWKGDTGDADAEDE